MAELGEISAQTAADVVVRPSLSPSTLAAAGGRLCSAGSRQLCCLRRPELPSAAPGSGRAG